MGPLEKGGGGTGRYGVYWPAPMDRLGSQIRMGVVGWWVVGSAGVRTFCTAWAIASKSSHLTMLVPPIMGAKGVLYCCLYVRARAPMVRPWKELVKDMISWGAVASASYGSIPAAEIASKVRDASLVCLRKYGEGARGWGEEREGGGGEGGGGRVEGEGAAKNIHHSGGGVLYKGLREGICSIAVCIGEGLFISLPVGRGL
jgi:hypothetical protein